MNARESAPVPAVPRAVDLFSHLDHWVVARPHGLALVHKRRGQWKGWYWDDVRREVAHLREALQRRGFGPGACLAVAGAYEPTLLLLALAARAAGGQVVPLPRTLAGPTLSDALNALGGAHLFVAERDGAARVQAAVEDGVRVPRLYLGHLLPCRCAGVVVEGVADLYAGQPLRVQRRLAWRHVRTAAPVWVEEGTEWAEGLGLLCERLVTHGEALAFPEGLASASRDRCDIAPATLLLSSSRAHALHAELENRVAVPGSLRRRVWDWAQRGAGQAGLPRHVHTRVRRIVGLHRLRAVAPAAVDSAWLRPLREDAR